MSAGVGGGKECRRGCGEGYGCSGDCGDCGNGTGGGGAVTRVVAGGSGGGGGGGGCRANGVMVLNWRRAARRWGRGIERDGGGWNWRGDARRGSRRHEL